MSDNQPMFDELFIDALAEILNIGMGNAAAVLSEMVDDTVILNVPRVDLVSRVEAANFVAEKAKSDVCGVQQKFEGAFDGEAMLLFPQRQSLELVRAVLHEEVSLDDLTEMEQEAMTEIGNIILNACLCGIADMFSKQMTGEIPTFIKGTVKDIFALESSPLKSGDVVILLEMDFSISKKNIRGFVNFFMDVKSIELFQDNIMQFMNGT